MHAVQCNVLEYYALTSTGPKNWIKFIFSYLSGNEWNKRNKFEFKWLNVLWLWTKMDKWCASAIGIQFALSHNILFGLFWKPFGYCGSVTPKVVTICENLILLPFESRDFLSKFKEKLWIKGHGRACRVMWFKRQQNQIFTNGDHLRRNTATITKRFPKKPKQNIMR